MSDTDTLPDLRVESASSVPSQADQHERPTASVKRPHAAERMTSFNIADWGVVAGSSDEAIDLLQDFMQDGGCHKIGFFNSNFLIQADRAGIKPSDWQDLLLFNDGLAADLAALITTGRRFPDNLNGTDLVPRLLNEVPRGTRVFLFGARPGIADRAAEYITRTHDVTICGTMHGYGTHDQAADAARKAKADIVLVALGNPLQERWIIKNGDRTGAKLVIGIGALFDYMSGEHRRAPEFFQKMRAEWLYRLVTDPGRLGRRYTVDAARFFKVVLSDVARSGRRAPEAAFGHK